MNNNIFGAFNMGSPDKFGNVALNSTRAHAKEAPKMIQYLLS